jgi:hypothetical protein
MKRTSLICTLMLGLVFSWSMACAEDFYVIPVKHCDYAMLAPFEMIANGMTPGGSQYSLVVPSGQRLVITDLLI